MLKIAPPRARRSAVPATRRRSTTPSVVIAHPSAELYGSDRMMLESITAMVERGWQVTVTVPSAGPLVAEARARGASVVHCPAPVLRKAALSPRGFAALALEALRAVPASVRVLRRARPDVVYVSTVTIPMWLPLARLLAIPTVCHVHEAESSAPALVRKAMALPLLLAGRIVANSRFSLDVLDGAFPALAPRSELVYNGVQGPASPTPARTRIDTPARLLYVGRLSPRKGIDVAVEALADLVDRGVDARLDLLGAVFPGYEWFQRDLVELAERRGVSDRLTFLGFQPEVWRHAAAADVLLVPSRFDEPFGNTAVEAVLAARPVVVSDTSGLREAAAGYASAQTVAPGDSAAIADAVQRVLTDWSRFRQLAYVDSATAAVRHAPGSYRDKVAASVALAAGRPHTAAPAVRPVTAPLVIDLRDPSSRVA